jgi:hypothetical protein
MRRARIGAGAALLALLAATPVQAASMGTFEGRWYGHTRSLLISGDGRAVETIYAGCCSRAFTLHLQLSDRHGTTVRARVVKVDAGDEPAPAVGATGVLRLRSGVITEPITGTNYCNQAAGMRGACGA